MDSQVVYDGKPVRKIEVEYNHTCKDGWPWILRVHFFKGSSRYPGRYRTYSDALRKAESFDQIDAGQKGGK